MSEVVDPLHGIPVSYYLSYGPLLLFSQSLTVSLIGHSVSIALPAVIGGTGMALLSQFNLIQMLQWTMIRARGQRNLLQGNPTIY